MVWLDLLSKCAYLLSALFYISVHGMNGNLLVVVRVLIKFLMHTMSFLAPMYG